MSRSDTLVVGVAQIDPHLGQVQRNLESHLELIEQARQQGVEFLVFPETSLTGYPRGAVLSDVGLRRGCEPLERIAEASEGLVVAIGLVEEAPAAQFYNSCMVFADGELVHIHRKLNLATYGNLEEGKYFAQGRYVEVFDIGDFWRVSVLVCADAWNPALVHLAALHGAVLLVIPTNSAEDAVSSEFSNPDGWNVVTRFYAMIYGMPIVMANRVGSEDGLRYWGASCVVDPFGNVIDRAGQQEETLLRVEIDYALVRRARIQLPTVRDSNLALVHREIRRLEKLIGVPPVVR